MSLKTSTSTSLHSPHPANVVRQTCRPTKRQCCSPAPYRTAMAPTGRLGACCSQDSHFGSSAVANWMCASASVFSATAAQVWAERSLADSLQPCWHGCTGENGRRAAHGCKCTLCNSGRPGLPNTCRSCMLRIKTRVTMQTFVAIRKHHTCFAVALLHLQQFVLSN